MNGFTNALTRERTDIIIKLKCLMLNRTNVVYGGRMAELYSLELIITGKRIQKAGLRSVIENKALNLGITGTAENIEEFDETGKKICKVKVTAEGTEDELREFIKEINKINTFHELDKIDEGAISTKKSITKRTYPEFIIKRDPEKEVPERMDEAVYYVKHLYGKTDNLAEETRGMRKETQENFKTMETKYHTISENLDTFVQIVAEYVKQQRPESSSKIDEILKKRYKKS